MFDLEELNRRMVGRWGEVFSPYLRNVQARGDERRARCPFHDDRSPSFGFNVSNGLWICRAGCGGGNGFKFLERAGGMSFAEAVREVAAMVGMDEQQGQAVELAAGVILDAQHCQPGSDTGQDAAGGEVGAAIFMDCQAVFTFLQTVQSFVNRFLDLFG